MVTTPAGGQIVIENIPGAIPSPMTFSQTVIDAGQTVGGLAGWSTSDKSALASLMANGTTDGCHRLYKTVNPPIEYECIGACFDCETITVVGGTSTGKAVLTLQPN